MPPRALAKSADETPADTLSERAAALIRIAHPDFRDHLEREARDLGYLSRG